MLKSNLALLVVALVSSPLALALAWDDMGGDSSSCGKVAKACDKAGYTRDENADKKFWKDCMEPLLLNNKVTDVSLDEKVIAACRTDKIDEMKKEIKKLEKHQ